MFPERPTATNTPELDDEEVVVVSLSVVVVLSSEVVVLSLVVEEPPSLLLLQEMTVKLKRKRERIMSICFIWLPISGLGELNLYQNLVCFTRIGEFYLEFL
jgi:hypothetical protein